MPSGSKEKWYAIPSLISDAQRFPIEVFSNQVLGEAYIFPCHLNAIVLRNPKHMKHCAGRKNSCSSDEPDDRLDRSARKARRRSLNCFGTDPPHTGSSRPRICGVRSSRLSAPGPHASAETPSVVGVSFNVPRPASVKVAQAQEPPTADPILRARVVLGRSNGGSIRRERCCIPRRYNGNGIWFVGPTRRTSRKWHNL